MCKIITLSNVSKVKGLQRLIDLAQDLVGQSERDGFGYAVQTDKGLFVERTVRPDSFKPTRGRQSIALPFASPVSNSVGTRGKPTGAIMFHGRTSTNTKSLLNTHPIVKHGWTLIHNGVVSNHGRKYDQFTSNDTEHLVEYLSNEGINGVASNLTGYYAVTAIDPQGRLHVIRDSTARLSVAFIESIDSFIFATRPDHIEEICREMKWKLTHVSDFELNCYLVLNKTSIESVSKFEPRGSTSIESAYSGQSLGYSISTETDLRDPTVDQAMFLEEMDQHGSDHYSIEDFRGNTLSYDQFKALPDDEKLLCSIIRPDGTIVSPDDYSSDRYYYGSAL